MANPKRQKQLEKQHTKGYKSHPVTPGEFDVWESEQVWGDDYVMTPIEQMRMDKTTFSVSELRDESEERTFWHKQPPSDRLRAIELMRQVMYGYDPATTRLQRVLAVVERQSS